MKPIHSLLAIACTAIWGLNFVITKIGLEELPPIFFTCLRYTVIAIPCAFFIRRGELSWDLIIKVGVSLGVFMFTLAFIGIKLGVSAGLTSLLMQTQIIYIIILSSILLKDRPKLPQIIGIAISACGIGILIWSFYESPTLIGLCFVLAGAFSGSITSIFMKQGGNYDAFKLMVWMSIIPPIPLLGISLIFETGQWESLMAASYKGIGAVYFNAYVSTLLGFGASAYLIKVYSPNILAPYLFLVPIFGFSAGYLILGETLEPSTFIASLIIMIGLLFPNYISKHIGFKR